MSSTSNKNLGVLKNCIGSFSSNVDDNTQKTRNKAGMISSSHLDRRKVNLLIYVNFGGMFAVSVIWYWAFHIHSKFITETLTLPITVVETFFIYPPLPYYILAKDVMLGLCCFWNCQQEAALPWTSYHSWPQLLETFFKVEPKAISMEM